MKTTNDHSILAWDSGRYKDDALLAKSPSDFTTAKNVVSWGLPAPLEMTSRGLRTSLPILKEDDEYLRYLIAASKRTFFPAWRS
jgi:hypothetical protein